MISVVDNDTIDKNVCEYGPGNDGHLVGTQGGPEDTQSVVPDYCKRERKLAEESEVGVPGNEKLPTNPRIPYNPCTENLQNTNSETPPPAQYTHSRLDELIAHEYPIGLLENEVALEDPRSNQRDSEEFKGVYSYRPPSPADHSYHNPPKDEDDCSESSPTDRCLGSREAWLTILQCSLPDVPPTDVDPNPQRLIERVERECFQRCFALSGGNGMVFLACESPQFQRADSHNSPICHDIICRIVEKVSQFEQWDDRATSVDTITHAAASWPAGGTVDEVIASSPDSYLGPGSLARNLLESSADSLGSSSVLHRQLDADVGEEYWIEGPDTDPEKEDHSYLDSLRAGNSMVEGLELPTGYMRHRHPRHLIDGLGQPQLSNAVPETCALAGHARSQCMLPSGIAAEEIAEGQPRQGRLRTSPAGCIHYSPTCRYDCRLAAGTTEPYQLEHPVQEHGDRHDAHVHVDPHVVSKDHTAEVPNQYGEGGALPSLRHIFDMNDIVETSQTAVQPVDGFRDMRELTRKRVSSLISLGEKCGLKGPDDTPGHMSVKFHRKDLAQPTDHSSHGLKRRDMQLDNVAQKRRGVAISRHLSKREPPSTPPVCSLDFDTFARRSGWDPNLFSVEGKRRRDNFHDQQRRCGDECVCLWVNNFWVLSCEAPDTRSQGALRSICHVYGCYCPGTEPPASDPPRKPEKDVDTVTLQLVCDKSLHDVYPELRQPEGTGPSPERSRRYYVVHTYKKNMQRCPSSCQCEWDPVTNFAKLVCREGSRRLVQLERACQRLCICATIVGKTRDGVSDAAEAADGSGGSSYTLDKLPENAGAGSGSSFAGPSGTSYGGAGISSYNWRLKPIYDDGWWSRMDNRPYSLRGPSSADKPGFDTLGSLFHALSGGGSVLFKRGNIEPAETDSQDSGIARPKSKESGTQTPADTVSSSPSRVFRYPWTSLTSVLDSDDNSRRRTLSVDPQRLSEDDRLRLMTKAWRDLESFCSSARSPMESELYHVQGRAIPPATEREYLEGWCRLLRESGAGQMGVGNNDITVDTITSPAVRHEHDPQDGTSVIPCDHDSKSNEVDLNRINFVEVIKEQEPLLTSRAEALPGVSEESGVTDDNSSVSPIQDSRVSGTSNEILAGARTDHPTTFITALKVNKANAPIVPESTPPLSPFHDRSAPFAATSEPPVSPRNTLSMQASSGFKTIRRKPHPTSRTTSKSVSYGFPTIRWMLITLCCRLPG
ncbi:hypothetical protein Dda_6396 [Drechslerella dactyloides]|uniref:Uncharacterized protein n=1 Tax=Drechslerella dactyloides TaxID=74499 RepID=A0AAD6NG65_DREDA|nr:hypothetical protein Dda_6396 [Drechslerella dactyloides]